MSGIVGSIASGVMHGLGGAAKGPVGRAADHAGNIAFPTEIPSPPEIFWAHRVGLIDSGVCRRMLVPHGIDWFPDASLPGVQPPVKQPYLSAVWDLIYRSQEPRPVLGEMLQLVNRGNIPLSVANFWLQRSGFSDDAVRQQLLSLRDEIPGPGDLVRFAVRHVFEPSLTTQFGFAAEMPRDFLKWHEKQGFGYPVDITDPITGQKQTITWAQAHWMAHWVWPSPGQGYQFLQRLRPTGGLNGGPRDPSGIVFTVDQLRLLLRGNDYAPIFRGPLQAISYRVLGIRPIAQMRKANVIKYPEMYQMYLDLGYNDRDAKLYSDLTESQATKGEKLKTVTGVKAKLLAAYEMGISGREQTALPIYRLSLADGNALAEFDALPPGQQTATALADPSTRMTLDAADLDWHMKNVREAIAATRRMYFKGRLDRPTAQGRLIGLGLNFDKVKSTLEFWDLEFTHDRKELAAGQVLKALRFGIIAENVARQRLSNLGWEADDVNIQVGLTHRDMALDLARAQAGVAKTEEQRKKALEAAARAARTAHNRARSELARYGSRADLVRWFVHGLMDEPILRRRLAKLDLTPILVENIIAEAAQKRQDWLSKARSKAAGKPPANGAPAPEGQ